MDRPQRPSFPSVSAQRAAFTLIELIVVVGILVTVAAIALMRMGEMSVEARSTATESSFVTLREAIVGSASTPGFVQDLGEPPLMLADLFDKPDQTASGVPVGDYDPIARRGWNGPYLARPSGEYETIPIRGFLAIYGFDGQPCTLDGWGHPIVLQWPSIPDPMEARDHTRLVSAGPDGVIQTPLDVAVLNDRDDPDPPDVGDDLYLYLFRWPASPLPHEDE